MRNRPLGARVERSITRPAEIKIRSSRRYQDSIKEPEPERGSPTRRSPLHTFIKRTLGATLGLAALIAAPAQANEAAAGTCTPAGALAQAFAPFGDAGWYTPVLDAGLEHEADGWTFTGDAAVTDGNEPWFIGAATDDHALDLPAGASATTAPFCVDETFTHFRAFTRGTGTQLRVELLYTDAKGKAVTAKVDDIGGSAAWAPTGALAIDVVEKAGLTTVPVAFRFTAKSGDFQVDDVYVDPWARS
jgi:hypothetical protein